MVEYIHKSDLNMVHKRKDRSRLCRRVKDDFATKVTTKLKQGRIGGGGGVHIHIFRFCPTNFF